MRGVAALQMLWLCAALSPPPRNSVDTHEVVARFLVPAQQGWLASAGERNVFHCSEGIGRRLSFLPTRQPAADPSRPEPRSRKQLVQMPCYVVVAAKVREIQTAW